MSMCVQNVGVNNSAAYRPNFKGVSDVKEIDKGSYIERHVTTEASNGKKWGTGIASIVDAVKSAKSETVQIVNKGE